MNAAKGARRVFLGTMVGGLVVAPRGGRAQPTRTVSAVGFLHEKPAGQSAAIRAVKEGLHGLGYVEGQTITFEVRFGGEKLEALPSVAQDLVQRKVTALVAIGPAALKA